MKQSSREHQLKALRRKKEHLTHHHGLRCHDGAYSTEEALRQKSIERTVGMFYDSVFRRTAMKKNTVLFLLYTKKTTFSPHPT